MAHWFKSGDKPRKGWTVPAAAPGDALSAWKAEQQAAFPRQFVAYRSHWDASAGRLVVDVLARGADRAALHLALVDRLAGQPLGEGVTVWYTGSADEVRTSHDVLPAGPPRPA